MSVTPLSRLAARLAGKEPFAAFVRSVGALSMVRLVGGLALFASQVLLARWMGHEAFGIYSYAWAWVAALASIASLGLPAASVRFIAGYRATAAHGRIRGLVRFATRATLAVALAIAAVGIPLAGWLARDSSYLPALQISFVAIPALTMLALDAAFARAFGWMALSASAEQVVRPLVLIALGAICLQWFPELSASGWVTLCALAYVVSALGQHAVVRRLIAGKVHTSAEEQLRHDWLRVGFGMLLLGSAQLIRANTDLLLVGSMLGPAELGIYTAAVRTATLVAFFLTVSSVVAQPRMAEMHAQGRKEDLRRFVRSSTRMTLVVSLAIGVVLVLLGKPVLELFGTGFVRGYPVLLALIAGHVLAAASGPLTSLLMMCGHHQRAATLHVASMLTNAALVAWLTPRYGILGAAVATSVNLALTQLALRAAARRALR